LLSYSDFVRDVVGEFASVKWRSHR